MKRATITILLGLILLGACTSEEKMKIIKLKIGANTLLAEVADTPGMRQQGLMHRKELAPDSGMLFVFEQEEQVSFWMKDTPLPLSIAYISKSGVIREIHDLEPFSRIPVRSRFSVLYALEVNRGYFKDKGIEEGDRIEFPEK